MESLVAGILRAKYGDVLTPDALLDVPAGWLGVTERCLQAARELHPKVFVSELVRTAGLMCVSIGINSDDDAVLDVAVDRMHQIATDARHLSAWTCEIDGGTGWLVDTDKGRQVLSPKRQAEAGIIGGKHEA